jgi:CheY-like chemotaxis protein
VSEAETVAAPERLVTGYKGPPKKVLVVDDVAANRAMAVDMLRPLGFDVVEAVNGTEALHKAQAARPDWILMDMVMPEMDGLEATRRLRQLPGLKSVPIIAMSASASDSDERKSLAAGANAFVPKPIDVDQLLTHIATLLKNSTGPTSCQPRPQRKMRRSLCSLRRPGTSLKRCITWRVGATCAPSCSGQNAWPVLTRAIAPSPTNCACWPRVTSPRPF